MPIQIMSPVTEQIGTCDFDIESYYMTGLARTPDSRMILPAEKKSASDEVHGKKPGLIQKAMRGIFKPRPNTKV